MVDTKQTKEYYLKLKQELIEEMSTPAGECYEEERWLRLKSILAILDSLEEDEAE